jgi:CheY-like chemotaxis protein
MRTLLLVEDDDAFRYAASRYLNWAGFRVVAVRTTMEALREMDFGLRIDALVTDVSMPTGNPHGVSFALMAHRRIPATPILFMTAFPDLIEDYPLPGKVLCKPVSLEKLTDEIEALFSPVA